MLRAGTVAARATRALSRMARRGGTTAPGRVLLRLEPRAIRRLGARLSDGSVLVSATNGKTTTASMIAAALEGAGEQIVHNRAGSNMNWGVATALLEADGRRGQLGLFEVDEFWLPQIADQLEPKLMLLSNLFRDQLDRYGELELIADRWAGVVAAHAGRSRFVLNADDPLVADLGRERPGAVYFGIDDDSHSLPALEHASDSKRCRNCGHDYVYDAVYLAHMGRYHCPSCGRRRPEPQVVAERIELDGMRGSRVAIRSPAGPIELRLPLPGLYNVYNALAATATALELGLAPGQVKSALEGFAAAFGRVERIEIGGRELLILLVKNPAGANEVLRTLALEDRALDLWLALNDRVADGRDISWIWDADFELIAGRLRNVTCAGTRAEEMALRLKYAGVQAEIGVERDLGASLDRALAAGDGTLYALPTYTALLELRDLLTARGAAGRWSA